MNRDELVEVAMDSEPADLIDVAMSACEVEADCEEGPDADERHEAWSVAIAHLTQALEIVSHLKRTRGAR